MIRKRLLVLPLVLVGLSLAQDTNFSVGPQYLVTSGSTMLLRPIATPSLSLGEVQPVAANFTATEASSEQELVSAAPSEPHLGNVYWGGHKASDLMGRRLETPSMTASDTAAYMNFVANQANPSPAVISTEAETPAATNVMELSNASVRTNLPSSILEVGVTGTTESKALMARGYGLPLGDVAAYWKSHKRTAPRRFTNADVVRQHE